MSFRRTVLVAATATAVGLLGALVQVSPAAAANQPVPGHTRLAPDTPRTNTPRISNGEIWDIEVVGNRVFVAGTFTSLTNTTGGGGTVNQAFLAAYNIDTGLIDTTFRPTFGGGGVNAVEASPDGTGLYVGGTFNTINGVTKRKLAKINLTTGAADPAFTATGNNQVNALAVSDTTVYAGGRFSKINTSNQVGLVAVNRLTGAVDTGFNNQLSGGIGVDGTLTVQQLKLTHDNSKLLVVHTARRIAGQDRLGVGIIDTASKQLTPWRTRLWDDNLALVGGIQRVYAGDIAPNDEYFVVASGSGGDRPPINDTAIAFDMTGGDNMQPRWITRNFDSVYSVAITEQAVYIGGHFSWTESPSAPSPWPGLDNVGYGTGQGLSGYGLGDAVVRRDHLAALDPTTGHALEWNPGSNSFEGNKAMEATPRGLFAGGDANIQGGVRTGRIAFFDFNNAPAPTPTDTTITDPIEGRVVASGAPFTITGTAKAAAGVRRVQVEIINRDTRQYLQDDGVSWGRANNFYATLASPSAPTTTWSLPVTLTGTQNLQVTAKAYGLNGVNDPVKATKKMESFSFDDMAPGTGFSTPAAGLLTSTSFTITGTASDDKGIAAMSYWIRDENLNYLQEDGTVAPVFNTFRGEPDVIGATAATWRYDVTVPHEGQWRIMATAIDTAGQADLRGATRDFNINSAGQPPVVTITAPVAMNPPTITAPFTVAPGSPMTFSGTATDDGNLRTVEIRLQNTTTRENLAADGTWGKDAIVGWYRVSPVNLTGSSFTWTYTTPFNLTPGQYTFTVRATDADDFTTATANQGRLTFTGQVTGDAFPDGILAVTGTNQNVDVLHLDLTGTATDDLGVAAVRISLRDAKTGRYLQPDGSMAAAFATLDATLANPGATSTGFTLPVDLPQAGDYTVTAFAVDTAGQQDPTASTARYLVFPGDLDPTLSETLGQPVNGATFTESRIFVSGRAEDDRAIGAVQVAIVNSAGQYMSSAGAFSAGERWINAFLNSPGSPASNYSYTSPILVPGTYLVRVRAVDANQQVQQVSRDVTVTVSAPTGNTAPVASFTATCTGGNVCSFDGRGSTDETPSTLTYAWAFGNGRTGTGPLPTYTYSTPGTFTVTLTVRDEFGATGSTTRTVTITEPATNVAPTAVISTPSCTALVCNFSGVASTDPNVGDTVSYLWNFGDATPTSTSSAPSHTFPAAGTYTVTLTVKDGWGKSTSTTRTVTVG